jgi:uncharacterized protein YggE
MKNLFVYIAASVIVFGGSFAWSQQSQGYDDRPKITVNGEAVVNVKPDKIVLTFGIETWNADIMTAKKKNNENYNGSPWWYNSSWAGWGSGRNHGMSQNVIQDVPGGSGEISETIALGKISIRANVSVTFELEK